MGNVVGIASIKGGVGKSTIAANAVGWLVRKGFSTVLVDCDEPKNRMSSNWIRDALPDIAIRVVTDPDELWNALNELPKQFDYVVVDTPGTSEMIRQLFFRCDMAIIPTRTGRAEANTLVSNVRLLRQAQEIRMGSPDARVVLSQVRKNYRSTKAMKELAGKLDMPLATTTITRSERHVDASDNGTFVWNLGRNAEQPAAEMEALFDEVFTLRPHRLRTANA